MGIVRGPRKVAIIRSRQVAVDQGFLKQQPKTDFLCKPVLSLTKSKLHYTGTVLSSRLARVRIALAHVT